MLYFYRFFKNYEGHSKSSPTDEFNYKKNSSLEAAKALQGL